MIGSPRKKFSTSLRLILASCLVVFAGLSACSSFVALPTPEPITLRFAYLGRNLEYASLAGQFQEANPHITIELVDIGRGDGGFQRFGSQFESADVVRGNLVWVNDQMANVVPLDGFLESDLAVTRADFFPGSLEALQVEGDQLGVPAGLDPLVMFYENLRFKIANIPPPTAGYSLDEFLATAIAVNNQEGDPNEGLYSIGFCTALENNDPIFFAYLFGGGLTDRLIDPTEPTLNRPENVAAVEWYASLFWDYQVAPQVPEDEFQLFRNVYDTSCGYWMTWMDMYGFVSESVTEPRILPLPYTGFPFSISTLDGYFITSASQHPQESWKWISFLLQHQDASGNQVPPMNSQINSSEYADRVPADTLAIAQGLTPDTVFIGLNYSEDDKLSQITAFFIEAVNQVILGESGAQRALDDAQGKALELFLNQP